MKKSENIGNIQLFIDGSRLELEIKSKIGMTELSFEKKTI